MYILIDEITKAWIKNQYFELADQLKRKVDFGQSGSEIYGETGQIFYSLREENQEAYLVAKSLIDKFLINWK
jgi:hypothetical protein